MSYHESPYRESNPDQLLRRQSFYPLNYKGMHIPGVEPGLKAYKTFRLTAILYVLIK